MLKQFFQFITILVYCYCLISCNKSKELNYKPLNGSDFLITNHAPRENTLVALSPGENKDAPNGKIILSGGNNLLIYHRPLFTDAASGIVDTISLFSDEPVPTSTETFNTTDNQIVKLKNGELLTVRVVGNWKPVSEPSPWWTKEEDIFYNKKTHKGMRLGLAFYSSQDGGNSWQFRSMIDYASPQISYLGSPRPLNCSKTKLDVEAEQCVDANTGNKLWFPGGPADRPELYFCPFTNNIYLTAWGASGISGKEGYFSGAVVFYSNDLGNTWNLLSDKLLVVAPIVMTSTPNGRLFLFNCYGGVPKIYYTDKQNGILQISEGFPVKYDPKDVVQIADTISINRNIIETISICRATEGNEKTDAVIVTYPIRNEKNNQEMRMLEVILPDSGRFITVPITTIRAKDPDKYSITMGNFIQPDFCTTQNNVTSSLSLYTFMEVPRKPNQPSYIKGCFVRKASFSDSFSLATNNYKDRAINDQLIVGDYCYGGFYWFKNRYNYVTQWPENDGIHCKIISADPNFTDGLKSNTN